MSSDGFQITIPGTYGDHYVLVLHIYDSARADFDEEEYSSTPIPFGRSAGHGFGGGGSGFGGGGFGSSGSGLESPTTMTPFALSERADRSYFHSRGDSVTSEDSNHSGNHSANHSMNYTARHTPSRPFAHSSQPSVATTSTSPFSKKPSFASIRNAFKSGKSTEAPPVPQIDHQAYPVLKNPFNRSTSSLAHIPPSTLRKASVNINMSPPHQRPPTPGSTESRYRTPTKSRSHSYAKSQHSHSESTFHTSENGSDLGHGNPYSASPPPVPRVPNALGAQGPVTDEEDKIVMDPRTPSDYALHAVFMRFAASAEMKIETFLRQVLVG